MLQDTIAILFLAYELGYWLNHYLSHRIAFLWEFHKVHHSATVLTPLTNFRVHPICASSSTFWRCSWHGKWIWRLRFGQSTRSICPCAGRTTSSWCSSSMFMCICRHRSLDLRSPAGSAICSWFRASPDPPLRVTPPTSTKIWEAASRSGTGCSERFMCGGGTLGVEPDRPNTPIRGELIAPFGRAALLLKHLVERRPQAAPPRLSRSGPRPFLISRVAARAACATIRPAETRLWPSVSFSLLTRNCRRRRARRAQRRAGQRSIAAAQRTDAAVVSRHRACVHGDLAPLGRRPQPANARIGYGRHRRAFRGAHLLSVQGDRAERHIDGGTHLFRLSAADRRATGRLRWQGIACALAAFGGLAIMIGRTRPASALGGIAFALAAASCRTGG